MRRSAAVLTFLLFAAGAARAQVDAGVPLERGRTYHFRSTVLDQTCVIDVSLPAGYATDSLQRYPAVYVLDGAFEQEMAAAITRFYADAGKVPPMIVVGIRNPDRFHELTTDPVPGFPIPPATPNPGGADAFMRFVGDELIPWVQRTYRADSLRVLVGHSLGGLFALHTLGKRPELFTGWVLMEPSAWWNNGRELNEAVATLRSPAGRHERVMAVNMAPLGLDTTAWGGDAPMVRALATSGETHTSMAVQGYSQALRDLFADLQPAEWQPGTRPIAMLSRYDSLTSRLGYSVPIPAFAFSTVARMSIDARYYDDAVAVIDRMERTLGPSDESRGLRDKLRDDRASEAPGFVQLEFPARRPTVAQAKTFLGHWKADGDELHEVDIRAEGDGIVVYDRQRMPTGMIWEGERPVIQVTGDGVLEWGLPVFRGLAALLVLQGKVQSDGSMVVTREVRGWVPVGPGPDLKQREVFRRVKS